MFLSRLTLNPRSPDAQRDLAAPYELHRTLAKAFPDPDRERHRARHGVLFRVEDAPPGAPGAPVLVQSTSEPDWRQLPTGYAARVDGPKSFEPALAEGQRVRYRLVANPVRRVNRPRLDPKPEGSTSEKDHRVHREPLVHPLPDPDRGRPGGYLTWLLRQADRHGFALPTIDGPQGPEPAVEHAPFRAARRRSNRRTPQDPKTPKDAVSHFGVRFDGTLTVTDPGALRAAVRDGIGPAKAYGFGLLSLAPA